MSTYALITVPQPIGPGWFIDTNNATYFLWAPTNDRPYWAACWTLTDGTDNNLVRTDSPSLALRAVMDGCPLPAEAATVGLLLLDAAHHHVRGGDA
jgi:hypothetical protein